MEELKDELQSMKADDELQRNLFDEVMTIKHNVLDQTDGDQSEWLLMNSLLKLHCMPLSVKILEATMIGKSVSALRNHASKNVRDIVRLIIKDWKLMVDAWLDAKKKNEEKGGDDDDDSNKNQIVPTSQHKKPTVIRIKLKNNVQVEKASAPKGPVTPEQKIMNQGFTSTAYSSSNGVDDDEVLRIKGILENSGVETESVLCDLLRKLHSMELSVKNLRTTGIGKTVTALKKHTSKDVSRTALTLVDKWKSMVNELIKKEANLVLTPTSKQIKSTSLNVERNIETNSAKPNIPKGPRNMKDRVEATKRKQQERYPEIAITESMQRKAINLNKKRKLEITTSIEEKFEATKRKLHAGYKEVENTKNKRRIQVMEFHELANEGFLCPTSGRRQIKPLKKPIKRIWSANGRR